MSNVMVFMLSAAWLQVYMLANGVDGDEVRWITCAGLVIGCIYGMILDIRRFGK